MSNSSLPSARLSWSPVWFSGLVLSTLWLPVYALALWSQSQLAAWGVLGCFLMLAVMGWSVWQRRRRVASWWPLRFFSVAVAMVTVGVLLLSGWW